MADMIARGAEAVILRKGDSVEKKRIPKGYRLREIDDELRLRRTRSEAKMLGKMPGVAPKLLAAGEDTLEMEFIDGDVVRNILDSNISLARKIGEESGKMHDLNIIHGDLTTSNMMLDSKKNLRFIDFGLSFVSDKVEDKAVDLHLFREAVESKHFRHENRIWTEFLRGYKPGNRAQVLKRLELVEKRGRNKQKY
jgi:Kae1-associated kinase Bud32